MSAHCTRTSNNRLMYYISGKRVTKNEFYQRFPNFKEENCQTKEQRQKSLVGVARKVSQIRDDQSALLEECKTQLKTCNLRVVELEQTVANNVILIAEQQKNIQDECKKELEKLKSNLQKKSTDDMKKKISQLRNQLTPQIATLKTENVALSEQIKHYADEQQERRDEIERLRQISNDCEKRHQEVVRELENRRMTQIEKERLNDELILLKQESNELKVNYEQLIADCREQTSIKDRNLEVLRQDFEGRMQDFTQQYQSLQERLESSNISLGNSDQERRRLENLLDEMTKNKEILEKKYEVLTSEHAETLKLLREGEATISDLRQEIKRLRQEHGTDMKRQIDTFESKVSQLKSDHDLERQSIRRELEKRLEEMISSMSSLNDENNKLGQENKNLSSLLQKVQTELDDLTSKNRDLIGEMRLLENSSSKSVSNLEKVLSEKDALLQKLEKDVERLTLLLQTESDRFKAEKEEIMSKAQTDIRQCNDELIEIKNQLSMLTTQLDDEKSQNAQKSAQIQELMKELEDSRILSKKQFDELSQVNQELRNDLEDCKRNRSSLQNVRDDLEKQKDELQSTYEALSRQFDVTKQLLEQCGAEKEGLSEKEKECKGNLEKFLNEFSSLNDKLFTRIQKMNEYEKDETKDFSISDMTRKMTRELQNALKNEGNTLNYLTKYNNEIDKMLVEFAEAKTATELEAIKKAETIHQKNIEKEAKEKLQKEEQEFELKKKKAISQLKESISTVKNKIESIDSKIDSLNTDLRKDNRTITENQKRLNDNEKIMKKNATELETSKRQVYYFHW